MSISISGGAGDISGPINIGDITVYKTVTTAGGRDVPFQLPSRPEKFVGRADLIRSLKDEVAVGERLSICAIGGMGKTAVVSETLHRLADEAVLLSRFPDGVLFHSFYTQPMTDQALTHIARSYGVDTRQDLVSAVTQALSGKQALIVLDGCEAADRLDQVTCHLGRCGVVITTCLRSDVQGKRYDLGTLPLAEGVEVIQQWAGGAGRG